VQLSPPATASRSTGRPGSRSPSPAASRSHATSSSTTPAPPASSSGTPSHEISNIPSGAPVFPFTSPLTTTFVLVPMSVHKPPRTTAAFIGIKSFETLKRCFFAQSRIAGTISATTGVLFMNAETNAGPIIVRSWAEAK
jgi:hypothetical protein